MSQTTMNIRVDSTEKRDFDLFCLEVGINTSVAINMFIKRVLRDRRIPFDISDRDSFYSEENQKRLNDSIKSIELNKNIILKIMEDNDQK